MGIGRLCMLFGKSRQAYYQKENFIKEKQQDEMIVLELVAGIRRELPGLGVHKIHWMLRQPLRSNGIKMGRDKLNELLRRNCLLIRKRKRRLPKTTDSYHRFKKYPNLIKELVITRVEEVWVSDITYICVGNDFNYLFLITDAHSHMIIGYCLHSLLASDGALTALEMALASRTNEISGLIHHSDRGVQYCSFDYVRTLREQTIGISMTESGDPYENAIAERVNGILKTEFHLDKLFKSRSDALWAVEKAISAYNQLRPHMSCDYLTPAQAHVTTQELVRRWKPRKLRQEKETVETITD
jgi:transposase InsO family protein